VAAAEDLVRKAGQDAFVALAAERGQWQPAVAGGVVADRRGLPLRDRHLEPDDAVQRDDLRERLRLRARGGVGERERLERPRAAAERRQQKRDHEHDRKQCEEREAAGSTRVAHLPTFDAPPPSGA